MRDSSRNYLKELHIKSCLENDVQSGKKTGFDEYYLINESLPDVSFDEVDTTCAFLDKTISAPFIISPMTGGIKAARRINENLAGAAQELNIVMCVGSQKLALDDPSLAYTYQVRSVAPTVPLLANLGAIYLNYGYDIKECRRAVDMIQADALVLYLNPLQKILQGTGQTNFKGLIDKIRALCGELDVPVIVKEIGCGLSRSTALALKQAGVWAIDVAGAGGTSWAKIEKALNAGQDDQSYADFDNWGIPTAVSLVDVVDALGGTTPVIASGGIRTGGDMAKAIALGASYAGIASLLLAPAMDSAELVKQKIELIIRDFKTAMFCCGKKTVADLRKGNSITKFVKQG